MRLGCKDSNSSLQRINDNSKIVFERHLEVRHAWNCPILKRTRGRKRLEGMSMVDFESALKYFDEDGDGKISPSELKNRVAMLGGGELLYEDAEMAVAAWDSDGDGFMSLDDFVELMEETGEEEKMKDLREAFEMYIDVEELSEFITPRSLKRMLGKLGESKSMDECQVMIKHFDLNGDGLLNFEEFLIMMGVQ
ncbi:hypothetical protein PIB30_057834 [Stylosanthes scabra]|uniref:EF-hand domain-containing protein n=1 Tax=Stylosanthes scabra TaxID=79078 RepID=A0ABU6TL47_9FABA|nr:hypothetical protein [Stylosanthes scabra]